MSVTQSLDCDSRHIEPATTPVTHNFDDLVGKRERLRSVALWHADRDASHAYTQGKFLRLLPPTLPRLVDIARPWRTVFKDFCALNNSSRQHPRRVGRCRNYRAALLGFSEEGRSVPGVWDPELHLRADRIQRAAIHKVRSAG